MVPLTGRRDALLGALLMTYALCEVLVPGMPGVGSLPGSAAVSAPCAAVAAAASAWRHRAAFVAMSVALAAIAVEALSTTPAEGLGPLVSLLLLLYAVAATGGTWSTTAMLVVAIGVSSAAAGDLLFVGVLFAGAWLAGRVLGNREAQLDQAELRLSEEAERAAEEERARIARELHDVVSHALTVVVLQAQAAEAHLESDPAAAGLALRAVKDAGQQALQDMRRMLGVLRVPATMAPQPGVDQIPALVAGLVRVGLPVQLHEQGSPSPVPPTVGLAIYRVVQEGLTNVLKHAGTPETDVRLCWEPGTLHVEVSDRGTRTQSGGPAGHGLMGITERLALVGGSLHAAPTSTGFLLRATVPL